MTIHDRIPIIDLFAGPGGLGEGFSRYPFGEGDPLFRIALSIEKEENAHRTLTLRAFFRQFAPGDVPEAYYDYLKGLITREELFDYDDVCREAAKHALDEAHCIELGDANSAKPDKAKRNRVRRMIKDRIAGKKNWVLIGGPPCQAYSLAGRSRMLGVVRKDGESDSAYAKRCGAVRNDFEKDHRHFLYREYLSIIADHWPPVFVMENVKGLLSAKVDGVPVFPKIREDLTDPKKALGKRGKGHSYRICSLAVSGLIPGEGLEGRDFLLRAEDHGVPQNRHRVILLGIRDDLDPTAASTLERSQSPCLREVFNGLPSLVPGVSKPKNKDLFEVAREILKSPWMRDLKKGNGAGSPDCSKKMHRLIAEAMKQLLAGDFGTGGEYIRKTRMRSVPGELGNWLQDPRLGGVCNHSTRNHMDSDLHRYVFCSVFASVHGRSPKLADFPDVLLPDHSNAKVGGKLDKFADRFRVQMQGALATTITCHISKDGHYFIHPDPSQIRSLTVREAARIQTFPDNYFFEGGRTAQYHQVGNAVPPYMAHQIAGVVARILSVE
ncbi:MAG TPA: DNA cytosine methyltransferase [Candidatus Obscuribacterales bacterium]